MNCKIFYRISSEISAKPKLPGANKIRCLDNFIKVFGTNMIIIADKCKPELVQHLKNLGLTIIETCMGKSASFRYILNLGMNCPDDTLIYFVEDDYLHLPNAKQLLEEGIEKADYVSLYDSPIKYDPINHGGETSKIFKTNSSHWHYSTTACMTFAAMAKSLKRDYTIWETSTRDEIPDNHQAFLHLKKTQKYLAVCIPGAACHANLSYSLEIGENKIEPWTIQILFKDVEQSIYKTHNADAIEIMEKVIHHQEHDPLELLGMISQIEECIKKNKQT